MGPVADRRVRDRDLRGRSATSFDDCVVSSGRAEVVFQSGWSQRGVGVHNGGCAAKRRLQFNDREWTSTWI